MTDAEAEKIHAATRSRRWRKERVQNKPIEELRDEVCLLRSENRKLERVNWSLVSKVDYLNSILESTEGAP